MNRSEIKKGYKQTKRSMGVYRIRNTKDGKSYIGFSTDLHAIINRHKAELNFGSHRNAELLDEWKSLGESSFDFQVLDELERDENAPTTPGDELRILHEMWLHKIEKTGDLIVNLEQRSSSRSLGPG